jgi:hypothetical protein
MAQSYLKPVRTAQRGPASGASLSYFHLLPLKFATLSADTHERGLHLTDAFCGRFTPSLRMSFARMEANR